LVCNIKRQLIVFTRFPVAGITKTRLISTLGADGAALLQRDMTEHLLKRLDGVHCRPEPEVEIRFDGGDRKQMRAWLGETYTYRPQGAGSLGHRMASAFENAFQNRADQAVLIGTDIPGLAAAAVEDAFGGLDRADVVFGPARDGGYYLIGMHREAFVQARILFKGLVWGTASVLADTLKIAAEANLRIRLLEELADVDRPEELPVWEQETAGKPKG